MLSKLSPGSASDDTWLMDPVTGKPFYYLTESGTEGGVGYSLWGVGFDSVSDGGLVDRDPDAPGEGAAKGIYNRHHHGDWVWRVR